MLLKLLGQGGHKVVLLASGLGFISAGAWVSFGLGAGLVSIGLSLIAVEEVSK